jgi:hypothetical protein
VIFGLARSKLEIALLDGADYPDAGRRNFHLTDPLWSTACGWVCGPSSATAMKVGCSAAVAEPFSGAGH